MTVLLDSNILIDHLNGIPEATAYIRSVHVTAAISVITRAEVLAGVPTPDALERVKKFLGLFSTLPLTVEIADAVPAFRQRGLKFPDAAQAALATVHQLKLATRNTKDFHPATLEGAFAPYTLKASKA